VSFAAVESWRGSVLVALDIDAQGAIGQAYVRDPSVMNWHGLELAVREELIGDFPLNNKSFNLSYAGFDL
jgi:Ni,Fe-hydrogenase III large subunit